MDPAKVARSVGMPVLMMVAALGLVACSSDSSSSSEDGTTSTTGAQRSSGDTGEEEVDACELVTDEEFSQVTGSAPTARTPVPVEESEETTRLGRCELKSDGYDVRLSIYPTEYWESLEEQWGPGAFEEMAVEGSSRSAFLGPDAVVVAQFDGKPWTVVAAAQSGPRIIESDVAAGIAAAAGS
jgi:hypothetical protein